MSDLPIAPEEDDPGDEEYREEPSPQNEGYDDEVLSVSEPSEISLRDVYWIEDEKIFIERTATTSRGKKWTNCVCFGTNNLNSDGESLIIAACDREYSRFTAEIAPEEGFDKTDAVTFYILGKDEDGTMFQESYEINAMTSPIEIDIDISGVVDLYLKKEGDYSTSKYAGQFINGYTGMCVLMRNATLYP